MDHESSRYRLLENLPDAFVYCQIITDDKGKPVDYIFLDVNPAFEQTTGLKAEEVVGKYVTEIYPGIENDGFDWIGFFGQVALTGKSASFEQYFEPAGSRYNIIVYSDAPGYFAVLFRDITGCKQAEEALKASEERYRLLVENIGDLIFSVTDQGVFTYVSPNSEAILGYKATDLMGRSFVEFVHPDDVSNISVSLHEVMNYFRETAGKYTKQVTVVYRARHKNGQWRWLSAKNTILKAIINGHEMVAVARDITEQKAYEAALQESEEKCRTIVENINDALVIHDYNGVILDINENTCLLLGYSREELLGASLTKLVSLQNVKLMPELLKQLITEGMLVFESEAVRKDGSLIPVEVSAKLVSRKGSGLIQSFVRDITERKLAEEALKESEQFKDNILENMYDLISITDLEGNFKFIGTSHAILGYDLDSLLGKNVMDFVHPEDFPRVWSAFEAYLNNYNQQSSEKVEYRYRCADGQYLWLETVGKFLLDENGKRKEIIFSTRDITERKQAEEALRKSEARVRSKLSSILSPQGGLDKLNLADIIDVEALQSMMNDFYSLTRIGIGIIDLEGTVLVSAGWQDICTKFHRVHPETARHCLESDKYLAQDVTPGTFKLYKCKNNMWDIATPLFIGDKNVGNLFLGQFFFEEEAIDYELFRSQAQKYGFNEKEYIDALEQVPRFSRSTLNTVMDFYTKFAHMTSLLSYSNLELARLLSERDAMIRKLKKAEQKLADYTQELEELYRYLDQEISKAQQVHEQILPQSLFIIENISLAAYYQPAAKMGGDFYDLIHCGNKLIFYLSDVSGHGMDGALLSLFVKNTINSYIDLTPAEAVKPKAVLNYLAEKFCRETFPEELYIAIFLAVLDLETMELTYNGAGFQESPMVRLGEGEQLELVSKGIVISRIFSLDALNLDEDSVNLSPGSTIFLTTDGLTEQGSPGAYYMDRLPDLFYANAHLPPELIKQIVVEDFRSFNGGSQQGEDDITFLVLQVDPPEKEVYRFELASDFTELRRLRQEFMSVVSDTDRAEDFLIGLHELVGNAIEHGNRLDPDKSVFVEIVLAEGYIQAIIEDQGEGFNWRERVDRLLELSGDRERGLGIIMTRLSSDRLVYNDKGNRVIFVKE